MQSAVEFLAGNFFGLDVVAARTDRLAVRLGGAVGPLGDEFTFAGHDWWHYSEKVRAERYDLDVNELKPYFDLQSVTEGAFIMAERLTHDNLKSNPHATYVFMESGESYVGRRLYLTKIREEKNSELIDTLRRRRHYIPHEEYYKENKYLVTFRIDKVLPLVGSGE